MPSKLELSLRMGSSPRTPDFNVPWPATDDRSRWQRLKDRLRRGE